MARKDEYKTEDIASDANRAAANIGGAIANIFIPGTGALISKAGDGISGIIDRSSGREGRERTAKAARDKESKAAQRKQESEDLKEELRAQDLRDKAEERRAKRRLKLLEQQAKLQRELSRSDRADRLGSPRRCRCEED